MAQKPVVRPTDVRDVDALWETVIYYHLQRYTSATTSNDIGAVIFNTNADDVATIGTYKGREQTNFPGPIDQKLAKGELIAIDGYTAFVPAGIIMADGEILCQRLMLAAAVGSSEDAKLMEPVPLRSLGRTYLVPQIAVSGGAAQAVYFDGSAFTKNEFELPMTVEVGRETLITHRVQIGDVSTLTAATNFDIWWGMIGQRLRTKAFLQQVQKGVNGIRV